MSLTSFATLYAKIVEKIPKKNKKSLVLDLYVAILRDLHEPLRHLAIWNRIKGVDAVPMAITQKLTITSFGTVPLKHIVPTIDRVSPATTRRNFLVQRYVSIYKIFCATCKR